MVVQSVVRCYIQPFPIFRLHSDVGSEAHVRQAIPEMEIDEATDQEVSRVRFHPRNGIIDAFMDLCAFKILTPQNSSVANAHAGERAGASARAARWLGNVRRE